MPSPVPKKIVQVDDLILLTRSLCLRMFGEPAFEIRIKLRGGQVFLIPVPTMDGKGDQETVLDEECTHSEDFRSCKWFGQRFTFTPKQAMVIKALWQAWEKGNLDVSHAELLQACDSTGDRISDIFRNNSAWNSMVCGGNAKGTYRLSEPTSTEELVRDSDER